MRYLLARPGILRWEMGALFNREGIAVYLPPPPLSVPYLINHLLTYVNSNQERFPLIKAFVTHLIFEKIHPFADGNGRVGRLLLNALALQQGLPPMLIKQEKKQAYYNYLQKAQLDEKVMFLESFFCDAFLEAYKLLTDN